MSDRLEEIKELLMNCDILEKIECNWLIAEVERLLQKEIELSKIIGDHVDVGEGRIKQIASLVKERNELKLSDAELCRVIKMQCGDKEKLEVENDELKDQKADLLVTSKYWKDNSGSLFQSEKNLLDKLATSEKTQLDAEEKLKKVLSLIRHDPAQGSGRL